MNTMKTIRNGRFEPTTSQKCARKIMRANYFGVEEAIKHFGVNLSKQQLAALSKVPFTEATLEECKNTHVLVAVFPMSIRDIHDKVKHNLFCNHKVKHNLFCGRNDAWSNKQAFAEDRGEVGWHLVKKTPVENPTSKTLDKLQELIGKNNEMPKARIMIYTIMSHFLATDERLFKRVYVQCSDFDSDGGRIYIGYFNFGSYGPGIGYLWGGLRGFRVGIASARKPDLEP